MAVGTLATADAILKDLYYPRIIEQLNWKTYMLDQIQRDSDHIDAQGRRAIIPVESQGNESPGSMPDAGTLVTPQIDLEQDAIVAIKYHDGAISISDALVKQATGNNNGAFVNKLARSTENLAKSMRKNLNRQVFGTGAAGTLAVLSSSPSAATTFTVVQEQYLRVGMKIDVLNISTGAAGTAGVTITGINRTTNTVTVSAAVTATTTTFGVFKEGSYGYEMEGGLQNATGTSRTLHSINSATAGNEFWNGNRVAASSAVAGEGLFEQLADNIGANGQGEVEVFLTTRGIRRRLADTYQSTKRFTNAQAVEIHGGYTAIFVNEIPVIVDDDVPKGWVFALQNDAFLWAEVDPPGFLTDPNNGTAWHLAMGSTLGTRKAAWEAWFTWYAALACIAPNRIGAIPDAQDES